MVKINLKEKLIKSGYRLEKNNFFVKSLINKKAEKEVENFGIQWNLFKKTQFDSFNGLDLTESRLIKSSGWDLRKLKGKLVLEMGSGAGRFTEIFLKYGAIIVSVELSNAVYANHENNQHENLFIVKDSLLNFKCDDVSFDYVFCYGVAQHVPNPIDVYSACVNHLKPKIGLLTIDHYWKRLGDNIPCFLYYPKYLWRPITTKLDPKLLLF